MADSVYVKVPKDLADCLAEDDFRSSGPERGIETALADGANLVTVLVGGHEVARFVRHLWATVRRRRNSPSPAVKLVVERGGRRIAITLEHDGFGDDGPPEKMIRGMADFLTALSESDAPRKSKKING
jgi:hypothetical protein